VIIEAGKWFGEGEWEDAGRPEQIATASTGVDHIDLTFMERMGVKVFSLLDDREGLNEIHASSEWTFALILMGLRRANRLLGQMDRGNAGFELYEKTVGIVGLGRIGSNIWRWCTAFGAHVLYYDPFVHGYTAALEVIFRSCNIVCVTCSFNEDTRGMIDYSLLERLPQDALLVNTSRGPIVNENDVTRILKERKDLTYAVDVWDGELKGIKPPYLGLPNVLFTPHIAGHTVESETKAHAIAEKLLYNRD